MPPVDVQHRSEPVDLSRRLERVGSGSIQRPEGWYDVGRRGDSAPPKKEEPFVMEIISGTKKAEQKFTLPGEGK